MLAVRFLVLNQSNLNKQVHSARFRKHSTVVVPSFLRSFVFTSNSAHLFLLLAMATKSYYRLVLV